MSIPEFENAAPRFSRKELTDLAQIVEATPKEPLMTPADDLNRRVWLALNVPAYKNDNRTGLFAAVKEAAMKLATQEKPTIKPGPINTESLLGDAIANQLRQPRDAYDPDAEEKVRKPFKPLSSI